MYNNLAILQPAGLTKNRRTDRQTDRQVTLRLQQQRTGVCVKLVNVYTLLFPIARTSNYYVDLSSISR